MRRGPLTGAEQGPSRNSSTNCMCPATEKSGPSPSVAHTSSPSRVGEPSRQQHTQMATGSSTAMSMWARPGPGQPGSGGAGTAPSPVRRSRAYCAGARCVPPPLEFVTIGEGQARIMLLGNAERRWASNGLIGIKTYKCMIRRTTFFTMALFSSEKISDFATVALSFLFDKYCLIIY